MKQHTLYQKIEWGPLRRLEALSRWMQSLDLSPDMRHLLDESIDDLRDVVLHLVADEKQQNAISSTRVGSWQGVPAAVDSTLADIWRLADKDLSSLDTIETVAPKWEEPTAEIPAPSSKSVSLAPQLVQEQEEQAAHAPHAFHFTKNTRHLRPVRRPYRELPALVFASSSGEVTVHPNEAVEGLHSSKFQEEDLDLPNAVEHALLNAMAG